MVIQENDQYWDKDTVKLDSVDVNVVKESPTALNLFQDRQTDDVVLSGELAQQMANDPALLVKRSINTIYGTKST